MNYAPYTIEECIQVMDELEKQLNNKHRTSPLDIATWPIFVRIIRSQASSLREHPPNLERFSSSGVGMLHTEAHHMDDMGEEWGLAYAKICRSVFCILEPDIVPDMEL